MQGAAPVGGRRRGHGLAHHRDQSSIDGETLGRSGSRDGSRRDRRPGTIGPRLRVGRPLVGLGRHRGRDHGGQLPLHLVEHRLLAGGFGQGRLTGLGDRVGRLPGGHLGPAQIVLLRPEGLQVGPQPVEAVGHVAGGHFEVLPADHQVGQLPTGYRPVSGKTAFHVGGDRLAVEQVPAAGDARRRSPDVRLVTRQAGSGGRHTGRPRRRSARSGPGSGRRRPRSGRPGRQRGACASLIESADADATVRATTRTAVRDATTRYRRRPATVIAPAAEGLPAKVTTAHDPKAPSDRAQSAPRPGPRPGGGRDRRTAALTWPPPALYRAHKEPTEHFGPGPPSWRLSGPGAPRGTRTWNSASSSRRYVPNFRRETRSRRRAPRAHGRPRAGRGGRQGRASSTCG